MWKRRLTLAILLSLLLTLALAPTQAQEVGGGGTLIDRGSGDGRGATDGGAGGVAAAVDAGFKPAREQGEEVVDADKKRGGDQ